MSTHYRQKCRELSNIVNPGETCLLGSEGIRAGPHPWVLQVDLNLTEPVKKS